MLSRYDQAEANGEERGRECHPHSRPPQRARVTCRVGGGRGAASPCRRVPQSPRDILLFIFGLGHFGRRACVAAILICAREQHRSLDRDHAGAVWPTPDLKRLPAECDTSHLGKPLFNIARSYLKE